MTRIAVFSNLCQDFGSNVLTSGYSLTVGRDSLHVGGCFKQIASVTTRTNRLLT